MKTSLHHRIHAGLEPMVAIILGVIALGSGILFWEWHSSHPGKEKHDGGGVAAHHHHQGKSHHTAAAG